jgi:hypothetical protein
MGKSSLQEEKKKYKVNIRNVLSFILTLHTDILMVLNMKHIFKDVTLCSLLEV